MKRFSLLHLLGVTLMGFASLAGCARASAPQSASASGAELLVASTPAPNGVVKGPLNQLVLKFSTPVRLMEITVSGPEGISPVMIESAGANSRFVIPLPGLGAGAYTAAWRASANGQEQRGNLVFSVRD